MASVRKKGPTFYACFTDHTGRRVQMATKARTRTEAKVLAGELERQAERQRQGLEVRNTEQTWGDLADLWLKQHAAGLRSYETTKGRLELHLRPALGPLKLLQVTPLVLDKLWNEKLKPTGPLSPQTVVHLRNIVSSTFVDAKRWRLWSGENPATVSQAPKIIRKPVEFAEVEEVVAILSAAVGEFKVLATCAVLTGLREGELLALRRENVDLKRQRISVLKTVGSETTKGGKWRPVPVNEELQPILAAHLAALEGDVLFPGFARYKGGGVRTAIKRDLGETLIAAGLVQRWDHVCRRRSCRKVEVHQDGTPGKLCAACGFTLWPRPIPKALTFHGLRHTYITHLLEGGADPFAVQRIAGHADLETTMRYAHAGMGYLKKQGEKLPSFCGPGVDSGAVGFPEVAARADANLIDSSGNPDVPGGIRTLVTGLKGQQAQRHRVTPDHTGVVIPGTSGASARVAHAPPHTESHRVVDPVLTMAPGPMITVADVAARLAVSTATIYAMAKAGSIPHQRLPRGGLRFDQLRLEAWLVASERTGG
jgi:integrase